MAALQSSAEGHPPQPLSRSFLDILSGHSSNNFQPPPSTSYRGFPSVAFSAADISRFAAPFRYALVGKFSNGRPSMVSIRKSFISIGFAGNYSLGLIDHRHILINFLREEDYVRTFLKRIYSIDGFTMRIFKWSPQFSVDSESAILPIWINFPLLPLHLFHKEALYSIARLIGDPLKLDASTSARSRPSVARVCVEIDLRKPRPEKVWIVNGGVGFWQPVEYENIPSLCNYCHKIGHLLEVCRSVEARHAPSVLADSLKKSSVPKARVEYRPKNVQASVVEAESVLPAAMESDIALRSNGLKANEIQSSAVQVADASVTQPAASCLPNPTAVDAVPLHAAATESVIALQSTGLEANGKQSSAVQVADASVIQPAASTLGNSIILGESSGALITSDRKLPADTNSDPAPAHLANVAVAQMGAAANLLVVDAADSNAKHPSQSISILDSVQIPLSEIVTQPATQEPATETSAQSLAGAVRQSSDAAIAGAPSMLANVATASATPTSNSVLLTRSLQPQLNDQSMTVAVKRNLAVAAVQPNTEASAEAALVPSNIHKKPTSSPNQPFSRAELDDLLKNVDDSPLPFFRRQLAEKLTPPKVQEASTSTCDDSHPSSDIILAPEIVDIAPLAVLHGDDASCFAEDNEDPYDVEHEFFLPIEPPSRVRGKNKKSKAPSDRVLRQRRNQKH